MAESTIYYESDLRERRWAHGSLADEWFEQYPQLFDDRDLCIVHNQLPLHFGEWYTAITLFEKDGAVSLVEKYDQESSHPRKFARYASVFDMDVRRALADICKSFKGQLPDLLVIATDGRISFSEVKLTTVRSHDSLSREHALMHEAIRRLGIPVDVIRVKPQPSPV